jgi:hypothetical protein
MWGQPPSAVRWAQLDPLAPTPSACVPDRNLAPSEGTTWRDLLFGGHLRARYNHVVPMTGGKNSMVWRTAMLIFVLALGQCLAAGQTSVTLDCDYTVRAGEPLNIRVAVDQAPSVGGIPMIVYIEGPGGAQLSGAVILSPGKETYEVPIEIPATTVGGIWRVILVRLNPRGRTNTDLVFKKCEFPIAAIPGLVLPSKADVAISASQGQLLRREAIRVQARIQQVKSEVSDYDLANHKGALTPLLRQALIDSVSALQATQEDFSKLAVGQEQRSNAEVFFGDLSKTYHDAISHLGRSAAEITKGGRLVRVSDEKKTAEPLVALALRPMEQNELAYKVVADEGSLVFDLEVDSTPEGAVVSYHRKGDQPRPNPDPTRSMIRSLPYAIWIIHFEKPGYRAEDREHDPFREPNHVVHVDLQK